MKRRCVFILSLLLSSFLFWPGCADNGNNKDAGVIDKDAGPEDRKMGCAKVSSFVKDAPSPEDIVKLSKVPDAEFLSAEKTFWDKCKLSYGEIQDADGKSYARVPFNKHVSLVVSLSGEGCTGYKVALVTDSLKDLKETEAFTALMLCHGHGVNTKPEIEDLGGGKFKIKGLLFHMPEWWRLYFDVMDGEKKERVFFNLYLEP